MGRIVRSSTYHKKQLSPMDRVSFSCSQRNGQLGEHTMNTMSNNEATINEAAAFVSAARFLNLKHEVKPDRGDEFYELPCVGDVILFNERYVPSMDVPNKKQRRGIGKVLSFTKTLMLVEVHVGPNCIFKESFLISDVVNGLFRYKKVYDTLFALHFNYFELDIDEPIAQIAESILA